MNEKTELIFTVVSVIYQNGENGYSVARAETEDGEFITVVGIIPYIGAGETFIAVGTYVNHVKHGLQFSVESYERRMPETASVICEYLSSGVIRGVGPKTAKGIVELFGDDTFEVMMNHPERLTAVKGITRKRAEEIGADFASLNTMRMLTDFLTGNKIPVSFAAELINNYGDRALSVLTENPYILCGFPFDLDFSRADALAAVLGIEEGDMRRLEAGALYELYYNAQNGHTFIPRDKLTAITAQLTGCESEDAAAAVSSLADAQKITLRRLSGLEACYLPIYDDAEAFAAKSVAALTALSAAPPPNLDRLIARYEKQNDIKYTDKQKLAISLGFSNGLSLITGGPGTGKTTALKTMLDIFDACGLETVLTAPTGRAAKRMAEVTGRSASTIHRLLECVYDKRTSRVNFKKCHDDPLDADVVIVDEASMLELLLACSLFDALKPHTRLILIGDASQLPPIGAGNFFADLLEIESIPRVELTEIFRQAASSRIVMNAHRINAGEVPDLAANEGDFYFSPSRSAGQTADTVVSLLSGRIQSHFGIPAENIQVICPSRKLECGTDALNAALQQTLNPPSEEKAEIHTAAGLLREGDKVMQIRNNYDILWKKTDSLEVGTGIFNGDVGTVMLIDKLSGIVSVCFDDRTAEYSTDDLTDLELAYAITAHKSQGSEYEAVVMPVFSAPRRLLNRSLFYTAVTRAKKLLVLVGRKETVAEMVASNEKTRRYGALKSRIRRALNG